MNFNIDDINQSALYVLKINVDGTFYTDYVEFDSSHFDSSLIGNFYDSLHNVKDNKEIEPEQRDKEFDTIIKEYFNKLNSDYPEILNFRSYCSKLALSSSFCDYRGVNLNVIQFKGLRNYYNDLISNIYVSSIQSESSKPLRLLNDEVVGSYLIEYAYQICKSDKEVKAYSHRQVGWKKFSFKLNDILTVDIASNFSFGSASYFALTLVYDNIRIIPFSRIVHYFYADYIQILNYTREYAVSDKSWKYAFDFVTEACNDFLKNGAESFIAKYMINECEQLTTILPLYLHTDTFNLSEKLYNEANNEQSNLKQIKLTDFELTQFRGIRVMLAVRFTKSILELKKLFPVQRYLDVILDCCITVIPELEYGIKKLIEIVKQLNEELKTVESNLSRLSQAMEINDNEIKSMEQIKDSILEQIIEEEKAENRYSDYDQEYLDTLDLKAKELLIIKHPDYEEKLTLRDEYEYDYNNQKDFSIKIKSEIYKHENYLDSIIKSKNFIDEYILNVSSS